VALKQDNSSGYAALRERAAVVDRAGTGWVQLTGADRRSYLQGLLTNDIEALQPGTGCYAAMLTAQGRMIADMRVLELGDVLLLEVPAALTASIREHLDRFVFAEDVQVADVTVSRSTVGIYGPEAIEVLQRAGVEGGAPARLYDSTRVRLGGADAILVSSDELGVEGLDFLVDPASAPPIRAALLAAGAVPADEDDVEMVRVESGHPRFGIDMDTDTIPLEAGIEVRAISRTKGCYVGQEVIVRVQDRGHGRVARRLVGLTLPASAPVPAAGAAITADGKDAGRVTSAVFSPSLARPIALAYVHRDLVASGTTVLVAGSGDATVALLPLVPR
jgi:tRNA-modifying protein YgfZ